MNKRDKKRGPGILDQPPGDIQPGTPPGDRGESGAGFHGNRPLKVAMACPGIGLVQRGFERLFYDIFDLCRDDIDISLYKGGGESSKREVVLRFVSRNGWVARYIPLHKLAGRTSMHFECLTFGVALLSAIRGQEVDVVHVIDPPLARFLYNLRNRFKLNFRILYTEGCAMPPGDYPPSDHLHQIAQSTFDDAVQFGWPEESMSLLPAGFYPERFETKKNRLELRASHNIGEQTFVILSVAAINRGHKRVDHLINEVAGLNGDVLLWLDGSMDQGDPELIEFAKMKLGSRCRITHVPSAEIGELLKMADVFVHAATHEAFGLAIIEAAGTGLPLLTHDSEHFRWLIPNPACWVNMEEKNALAERLQKLMDNRDGLQAQLASKQVLERYNWHALKCQYLALYQKVANLPLELNH